MITADQVCAVLVTRGDVNLDPIRETLPYGDIVIWDNGAFAKLKSFGDFRVFGRYMGILETRKSYIYFQDDDCIVRNHEQLIEAWEPGKVVGNFRKDAARERYFHDSTLLGWGSLFERELPFRAFFRYARYFPIDEEFMFGLGAEFTWPILTPSKKVIVEIAEGGAVEWLDENGAVFARADRMSNQPGFYEEMERVMQRAREVRDHDA